MNPQAVAMYEKSLPLNSEAAPLNPKAEACHAALEADGRLTPASTKPSATINNPQHGLESPCYTMPFDPSLPATNSPLQSQVVRDQLQALFNLINNIVTVTAAQIDGVSTVNPGDPASVGLTVNGGTLHFTFSLPRGQEGVAGQAGQDGGPGPVGPQGPPFANAVVDSVTTLPAGSPATVSVSFDGTLVHFSFSLPAGQNGANGADGIQGLPGEVTNAALAMSISGTSSNSNAVPTMDTAFSNDPPTLADLETMRAAHNALVLVLRR